MQRVAVVVPGIMGSRLAGPDGEMWGSDIRRTYARLLEQPTRLHWVGRPADATLLKEVVVTIPGLGWTLKRIRLWTEILRRLPAHPEFGRSHGTITFAYDWRQSLLEAARLLGQTLASYPGAPSRLVFITHSMGGLLVRIALARSHIPLNMVDQIIHVGSPLLGAPEAFLAAYRTGRLPGFRRLTRFFRRKNAERFYGLFLGAIQTFPSIYQLMPPMPTRGVDFIRYPTGQRSHPLREVVIPASLRQAAHDAHQALEEAERLLAANPQIRVDTIFTSFHGGEMTDLEFEVMVQGLSPLSLQYVIRRTTHSTQDGDGTVPSYSAQGETFCRARIGVGDVAHAFMCSDQSVIAHVFDLLG